MSQNSYQDCYYSLDSSRLIVGNGRIERQFDMGGVVPKPVSLVDKQRQEEWLDAGKSGPLYHFPFLKLEASPEVSVSARVDDDCGIAGEHWIVSVLLAYPQADVRLDTYLYPGKPVMRHTVSVRAHLETGAAENATAEELDENRVKVQVTVRDHADLLPLRLSHCRWRNVELLDKTDVNNNLVSETSGLLYIHERRVLQGNVMLLSQTLKQAGLLVLKEGPTPLGYLAGADGDFEFEFTKLKMVGTGLKAGDLKGDQFVQAYGSVVGVYDGSELGGLRVIHEYQQAVRPYKAERDAYVISNTWGDRAKDGRVSEAFILTELEHAARLGVSVVQIDDGWQQGVTSNSIQPGGKWGDYYSGDVDFWSEHKERFPRGLQPVVDRAKELGIRLGLWFSPDSTGDFQYWERDADTLIALHKKHGISYYKLDGIQLASVPGQMNLIRMMQKVVRETGGHCAFNLDTTNEIRQGYYNGTQYGNIFLENRYTDWHRYHPHLTLRNLWMLSKYVSASRLQMEFLNVARHANKYEGDPLAPDQCGIVYAFAAVMFACPLVWMELSGLKEEDAASLAPVMKAYRDIQADVLSGHILPVGEEPVGTGWTGMQSMVAEDRGYVIVYREYTEEPAHTVKLWDLEDGPVKWECLMRSGTERNAVEFGTQSEPQAAAAGGWTFQLERPFSFALYRYTRTKG